MKHLKKSIATIAGAALLFTACKKDDPSTTSPPEPIPGSVELQTYFDQNISDELQAFTIDASSTQGFTSANGTQITFNGNSFKHSDGSLVTGNVTIELLEIFDKSGMIRMNAPTLGNVPWGMFQPNMPLISGGEFRVKAFQNGEELELNDGFGYNVNSIVPGGGMADPSMQIFYGRNGDTLTWDPADSSAIFGNGPNYVSYFDSLNWCNIDYFMNSTGPMTTIEVELPSGFTNQNSALFISVDGSNSVAPVWGFENGVYTSAPSYQLPVGMSVHFVAMAVIGGIPQTAIVSAMIQDGHLEVIPSLDPTTDAAFESDLMNLP